ncbi:disulfide bond formation protein B [Methylocucumis oryzae]|uniref:disulfide bond formation protein B n=1 Tax=Methylocucumis oryzae TaxID=1632867 RepID=UPI0009E23114|nr:disulfide bond formation protein B [Methylocucumis oryzae]
MQKLLDRIRFTPRLWFFWGFLACTGLLLTAMYFQLVDGLEPCPLCISQRIAVFLVGVCFLSAAIHNPKDTGIKIYALLGALAALGGASISTRHVWLQHLPPDQVPECGPGLDYVFNNFPLSATIKLLLSGTGDCAKVDWTLLGFSMPAWTLVAFLSLAVLSLAQYWNRPGHSG